MYDFVEIENNDLCIIKSDQPNSTPASFKSSFRLDLVEKSNKSLLSKRKMPGTNQSNTIRASIYANHVD